MAAAAAAAEADAGYVCGLNAETEKKAQKELNEDPKDRLSAVQTLRTWIQQQPHLTFNADTRTLLAFLRTAKFSQLKAREIIENNARAITLNPHWLRDVDTHDPLIHEVIDTGYVVPLPKTDKNGCAILMYKVAVKKQNGDLFGVGDEIRASITANWYISRDENVQVNGFVFIFDMGGFTAKHMTRWTMDDMKRWNKCWQNAMPGRFKAFHYYNAGAVFEAMMAVSRPFLTKKITDRMNVHETLESLYKCVDMELLPTEYLPDDYKGPSAGPTAKILETFKRDIMEPEFRKLVRDQTSELTYKLDESKRPAYKAVNESFRKLAVD